MSSKIIYMFMLLLLSLAAELCQAYNFDPNDFAAEVVYYDEGTGADVDYITKDLFNDPSNALGRPTIDTTGENWNIPVSMTVPVVSVYGAFRSFELVTVGNGGELIVKFNHAVADDINNPFGIDFILFGNAQQNTGLFWKNGDPTVFNITSATVIEEPAMVSVSQDGRCALLGSPGVMSRPSGGCGGTGGQASRSAFVCLTTM